MPLAQRRDEASRLTSVRTRRYAADGFARVAGLGCVVLTFSVGELSAANAVAGAFAERVPLVVVVGVPAEARFTSSAWPHHTVGIDGKLDAPLRMLSQITAAQGARERTHAHACAGEARPPTARRAQATSPRRQRRRRSSGCCTCA